MSYARAAQSLQRRVDAPELGDLIGLLTPWRPCRAVAKDGKQDGQGGEDDTWNQPPGVQQLLDVIERTAHAV